MLQIDNSIKQLGQTSISINYQDFRSTILVWLSVYRGKHQKSVARLPSWLVISSKLVRKLSITIQDYNRWNSMQLNHILIVHGPPSRCLGGLLITLGQEMQPRAMICRVSYFFLTLSISFRNLLFLGYVLQFTSIGVGDVHNFIWVSPQHKLGLFHCELQRYIVKINRALS